MNETAAWYDMVSETTVDKTGRKEISVKFTGHEKLKVSVYLTAKADGTRLKSFIVFGGTMRECKSLNEEFVSKCVAISSLNAWMIKKVDTVLHSLSYWQIFLQSPIVIMGLISLSHDGIS